MLGEMLLLISRNERIEKALARLTPAQASMVVTDAIASLQRFLEGYGGGQRAEAPAVSPSPGKPIAAVPPRAGIAPAIPPVPKRTFPPIPTAAGIAPLVPPVPGKPLAVIPLAAEITPVVPREPRKPLPAIPPAAEITPVVPPAPTVKPLTAGGLHGSAPLQARQQVVSIPPAGKIAAATPRLPAAVPAAAQPSAPRPMPHGEPAKKGGPEERAPRVQGVLPVAQVNTPPPDPPRVDSGTAAEAPPVRSGPAPVVEKIRLSGGEEPQPDSVPLTQRHRESFDFEEQQAYLHGVSLIPLQDSPSPKPFLIGEQGLDPRSSMFAVDHAGMRFYLSELSQDSFSVSKNGLLLLNKADSIRLRGGHERILNRLRIHTMLLPAEFGTAVLGMDDLERRVEFRLHALLEFVLDLGKTTMWRVTASVMDDNVKRFLGDDPAPQRASRREAEQGRHAAPGKRIDVKSLERLLTREKKIAESILDILAPMAESHRIEHLVNLGSGRSEDWKPILTAVFTCAPGQSRHFFRAVVEVETVHSVVEPMLRVTGTTESFSLLM